MTIPTDARIMALAEKFVSDNSSDDIYGYEWIFMAGFRAALEEIKIQKGGDSNAKEKEGS